jgi:hypothetical protein
MPVLAVVLATVPGSGQAPLQRQPDRSNRHEPSSAWCAESQANPRSTAASLAGLPPRPRTAAPRPAVRPSITLVVPAMPSVTAGVDRSSAAETALTTVSLGADCLSGVGSATGSTALGSTGEISGAMASSATAEAAAGAGGAAAAISIAIPSTSASPAPGALNSSPIVRGRGGRSPRGTSRARAMSRARWASALA